MTPAITPQERARRSADAMWAQDRASQWLGLQLVAVGPGTAELRLTVADHHANGHGICHGGVIYSLADSAFAFACNSHNQGAVAQHNTITYLTPAKAGETLVATATEISLEGRTGVTDVRVTAAADGRVIAQFRGCSRTIGMRHFEEA